MLLGVNLTVMGQINIDGCEIKEGTPYFLKNIGSGLYLKFGGAWGTQAVEGHAATQITVVSLGNGNYAIKTNAGYLSSNLAMNGDQASSSWTLVEADKLELTDGSSSGDYQYCLKCNKGALTSKAGKLATASYQPVELMQRWVFLTEDQLRKEMEKSSDTQPFDITPLLGVASFDQQDSPATAWGIDASNFYGEANSNGSEYCAIFTSQTTISKTLSEMPQKGVFHLTVSGFQRNAKTATLTVKYANGKNGTTTKNFQENSSIEIGNNSQAMKSLNNAEHEMTIQFQTKIDPVLTIAFDPNGNEGWLCLDNLKLLYYGVQKNNTTDIMNPAAEYNNLLNAHIMETQAKVDLLNEAGQNAFNIDGVLDDINNNSITSVFAFDEAILAINAAYEVALTAHNQKELDDLLNNNGGSEGGNEGDNDEEENKEIDVTDLFIKNAGFGTGDDRYWIIDGAVISTTGIPVTGATGSYLFRGISISQDVAVVNGKYKLTAKVASTNGTTVTLTANEGKLTEQSTSLGTTTVMSEITLDKVIVYDGTLFIHATSDAEFYIDDFSLSYQESLPDDPQLQDTETLTAEVDFYPTITVTRTLKANTWSTFVVPFNMEIPEGWEVKTLAGSTMNDENITLTFEDAPSIEAGVPYMVRTTEATSTITGTNTWLSTALRPTSTDHVEFIGVHASCNVPIGSYFISNNKFYRCVNTDNPDRVKGYRGYISPTSQGANARSLGYRFASRAEDEEGTTAIDNAQMPNDNEMTVVGIYTLGGVRINDMQQGVNILQMNNGTTIKVIIK